MEKYGPDLEDPIHLAIALREKAAKIIYNDTNFNKTLLTRIFRIDLKQVLQYFLTKDVLRN